MHYSPRDNHILQSLPPAILAQWLRHGETIGLQARKILSHPGDKPRWTHFPLTAILAWINLLENGTSTAIALVGREGATGLKQLPVLSNHLMVHAAGHALRLPSALIEDTVFQLPAPQAMSRQFVGAFIAQISQTAACNRHHKLEQQLIRLLLCTLDRSAGTELRMTHEHMASMLGVRRECVSAAASWLQHEGLIRYTRGRIAIVDRQALGERACECYRLISGTHTNSPAPASFRPAPSGCE